MMLRSVTQESSEPMKRSLVVALLIVALLFASAC
ncbi:MAG: hypothetical protein ACJA0V_001385, partial [Planctomycetota bacterium]